MQNILTTAERQHRLKKFRDYVEIHPTITWEQKCLMPSWVAYTYNVPAFQGSNAWMSSVMTPDMAEEYLKAYRKIDWHENSEENTEYINELILLISRIMNNNQDPSAANNSSSTPNSIGVVTNLPQINIVNTNHGHATGNSNRFFHLFTNDRLMAQHQPLPMQPEFSLLKDVAKPMFVIICLLYLINIFEPLSLSQNTGFNRF